MPDEPPEDASWLQPEEKEWLSRTLAAERAQRGALEHASALSSLANPKVWLLCLNLLP